MFSKTGRDGHCAPISGVLDLQAGKYTGQSAEARRPNARLWSRPVARVVLYWEADALTAHLCYTLSARVRSLDVRRHE
jgi:hypothetical protein